MAYKKKAEKPDAIFSGIKGNKLILWLRAYLDESNTATFLQKTGAARAAGYPDKSCGQIGWENYKKLENRIATWTEEVGLSEKRLKQKLLSLTEAKETKFFQHEGIVTQQVEVEALGIQRLALDMALKVKGMYAPDRVQVEDVTPVSSEDRKALKDMARSLARKAAKG